MCSLSAQDFWVALTLKRFFFFFFVRGKNFTLHLNILVDGLGMQSAIEAWKCMNERNLWYWRVILPFLSGWKWFLCWVIPSVLLADTALNHGNCFGSGEDGNQARFWGINGCHNNFASLLFSSLNNALLSLFYFADMWATHWARVVPAKYARSQKTGNTLRHSRTPTSNPPASEKPQVRDSCLKYIFFYTPPLLLNPIYR